MILVLDPVNLSHWSTAALWGVISTGFWRGIAKPLSGLSLFTVLSAIFPGYFRTSMARYQKCGPWCSHSSRFCHNPEGGFLLSCSVLWHPSDLLSHLLGQQPHTPLRYKSHPCLSNLFFSLSSFLSLRGSGYFLYLLSLHSLEFSFVCSVNFISLWNLLSNCSLALSCFTVFSRIRPKVTSSILSFLVLSDKEEKFPLCALTGFPSHLFYSIHLP